MQLPLFLALFPLSFTLRSEGDQKVCPFYRGEELLARRLKNDNFLALEPTIQRHGRLSIGLSLKLNFIARQQEGLLTKALQQLA